MRKSKPAIAYYLGIPMMVNEQQSSAKSTSLYMTEPLELDELKGLVCFQASYPEMESINRAVIKAVNEKLLADGMGMKLTVETDYRSKYDLTVKTALASGCKDYDLINLYGGHDFYLYAKNGRICDLKPLLDQNTNLYDIIDAKRWDTVSLGDGIYGIPNDIQRPSGDPITNTGETLLLRTGKETPKSFEDPQELLDFAIARHEADGSMLLDAGGTDRAATPRFLHPSYPQWPFFVDERDLFVFDQNGKASVYIESEIFAQDAAWMKAFRDSGVLLPVDHQTRKIPVMGSLGDLRASFSGMIAHIAPDRGTLAQATDVHVVPSYSDPELALRFFGWLASDPENYDLLTLGIQGVHYTTASPDALPKYISKPENPFMGFPQYWWGSTSQYGSGLPYLDGGVFTEFQALARPRGAARQEALEAQQAGQPETPQPIRVFPSAQFVFDPTSVSVEYFFVTAALRLGDMAKIRDGFMPIAERDRVIEELKAEGLDAVLEECQRQYEAYFASVHR